MSEPEVVLRARILRAKQTGVHTTMIGALPLATRVEVERNGNSYFVIRYNERGDFGGDTWHGSLDDAISALSSEYEWERVEAK